MTLLFFCLLSTFQENWAQFRGPGARGVSAATGLPDRWSATENVVWKTGIEGTSWSSPIVWGDRIFLTSVVSAGKEADPKKGLYFGGNQLKPSRNHHTWSVICLSFDSGKVLWKKEVHKGLPQSARHIKNSLASETPCTDGERIYAYFGNLGLFVFDLDGNPLWERKWKPVRTRYGWGTAASPIVHEGRVYILNDNDDSSFIEALDGETGKVVWHVDRDEKSNWSTPYIWKNGKRTEIVTTGTGKVRSYKLDGKPLWELKGMSSITIPTPFADEEVLYIGSGYIGNRYRPMYAIEPGASGDISLTPESRSGPYIRWHNPVMSPYNPTPVLYKGIIYVLYDRGLLVAYDPKTGQSVYDRQRLRRGASAFTASPWAYDDKIFCLSEQGETFVIQAGKEYRLLHTNSLGEMCMATPAIAKGSLMIRTRAHLYRIGSP